MPQHHRIRRPQSSQDEDDYRDSSLSADEHLAPVYPIGDYPTEQDECQVGNAVEKYDQTQLGRRVGQHKHQPAQD